MQGLGNDYVYIDCTKEKKIENKEKLVRFLSDRHFGVGSDGVIFIHYSKVADFKMEMYNSDGTEAGMCGNGIRCVGKYVYDKKLTQKQVITVETKAGIKMLRLYVKQEKVFQVMVDMGEPILDVKDIPVILKENENINNLKIKALYKEFSTFCISMGNPHCVIVESKLNESLAEKYGPIIENDEHFPEKANVEFVQIIDRNHIKMRVWERGTGQTLACGTGACAAVAACYLKGFIYRNAFVELPGRKFTCAME